MATRTGSHQLSNGLIVSGPPEQLKDRQPTIASRAVPYTGGDVKKSGELGKMYGIDMAVADHNTGPPPMLKPSRMSSSSQHNSGSVRSGPNSGPMGTKASNSCLIPKKSSSSSGPMTPLQPTGLITSGPLGRSSGELKHSCSSSHLNSSKALYGSAVTTVSDEVMSGFKVSRLVMWVFVVAVLMGLLVVVLLMVAVKKALILVAVAAILVLVVVLVSWNCAWKQRGLLGFLRRYPDTELRGAIDGQYIKVTGVVTCGSIPLESSFQRIPRCVFVSTELYEYRRWGGKSANPKHRSFSWSSKHSEKYVADFYISDSQSGLRALVKAGYRAKVAPFVKPSTVVDLKERDQELSPGFLLWLADRGLSSDGCIMRLKEGYIKEGSTVSVIGVVRRHDNILMIVPPPEPISTGCQWTRCLLPTYIEGLVMTCDESQHADVIPV